MTSTTSKKNLTRERPVYRTTDLWVAAVLDYKYIRMTEPPRVLPSGQVEFTFSDSGEKAQKEAFMVEVNGTMMPVQDMKRYFARIRRLAREARLAAAA